MNHEKAIEEAKKTEQFQQFKRTVTKHYAGHPATARALSGKAWTLARKGSEVPPDLLSAVIALIPVLEKYTGSGAPSTRGMVQTLANHALIHSQPWDIVTLICEPWEESGPGAVLWASADIPTIHDGTIWDGCTTVDSWDDTAPTVAAHLSEYHGAAPLTTDQIRDNLAGARSRVYRTTTGTSNTWIHYQDADGCRFSARVSFRRARVDQDTEVRSRSQ